jgi:hypothetical protein
MLSAERREDVGIAPASPLQINNPKHWRDRAKEARFMAEHFGDPDAIATMLRVASQYEQLAKEAEARQQAKS